MMRRCKEKFTCLTCRRRYTCCESMPGWPAAERHDECSCCWERRLLPADWDEHLPKEKEKAERQRRGRLAVDA